MAGVTWTLVNRHLSPREAYPFIVRAGVNLMDVVDNLRTFLDAGEDWERKNTSLPGVSIIKLPATRSRAASLAIEINPPDENGRPMKKKGIMLMSRDEMTAFRRTFGSDKLEALFGALEEVVPERKTARKGSGDVIEI